MIKPFEINENILRKKTNNLLNRNLFEIYLANYKDLCSFGSTDIILKSKKGIEIEFIADNKEQSIFCNISTDKYRYALEDFLKVYNIPLKIEREDFLKMIETYSNTIYENKEKIFQLLDDNHKKETINRMRQFYNERLNK